MTVRTDTIAAATSGATAAVNIYTCPADTTTIVKDIRSVLTSAAAASLVVNVHQGAVKVPLLTLALGAGALSLAGGLGLWVVLNPGDTLEIVIVGAVAPVGNVWVSGTKLAGLAP